MKSHTNRKAAIELEIQRILELGLTGEDTLLIACDLIDALIELNQTNLSNAPTSSEAMSDGREK
ncbi:MAG: hypothetical protein ACFFDI_08680 [Promethearchaeota archaeon]